MDSGMEYWAAKAALDWQIEMGAVDAVGDTPVDRYALQDKPKETSKPQPAKAAPPPPQATKTEEVDVLAAATTAASGAQDLAALKAALTDFPHCEVKASARHLLFAHGSEDAEVMIITDAPDRADDRAGALMTGPKGVLLGKMLGAIGLEGAAYLAPVLPWNPPQDRDPTLQEIAMLTPFLERHITLAAPKVVVLMGNAACQTLLGRSGMTRLRGKWAEACGLPAIPIFPPSFLMANPAAKRDAWADLLALKAKLRALS